MAYMSKEHKAEIAAMLKKLLGTAKERGFKYTLSVRNLSSIEMNISEGSIDFLGAYKNSYPETKYATVSYARNFHDGPVKDLIEKILKVLNHRNYDNSDIQSDYFDIGHYVHINIGKWDKPYKLVK